MNDEPCTVEINGRTYYVSCNILEDIVYYDESLINTSNSSITLYSDYPTINDSSSGYPRISASANQRFYIRNSYGSSNTALTVYDYRVLNRHTSNDFLLLVVLLGVMVINLFKR